MSFHRAWVHGSCRLHDSDRSRSPTLRVRAGLFLSRIRSERAIWHPGRWLLSQICSFTLLHLLNTSVTLQSSVARFILHAVVQVNMVSRSSTQTLGIIRTRSHHKAAWVKTRGQLNRRPRFVLAGATSSPSTAPAVELEASTTSARLSRSTFR